MISGTLFLFSVHFQIILKPEKTHEQKLAMKWMKTTIFINVLFLI